MIESAECYETLAVTGCIRDSRPVPVSVAHAVVLEGVGHANIHNGNLEAARAEARKAAIRDLSLQYEARVSTHDTMKNGVITESRMDLASSARAGTCG